MFECIRIKTRPQEADGTGSGTWHSRCPPLRAFEVEPLLTYQKCKSAERCLCPGHAAAPRHPSWTHPLCHGNHFLSPETLVQPLFFSLTQRKQPFLGNESPHSLRWSIAFLTKTLYKPWRPELEVPAVKTSVPADFSGQSPCKAVTNLQEWWRRKVKGAQPPISLTQVSRQEPTTALPSFLALGKESEAGRWRQK